ncbi:uncharacterized protein LOC129746609 [Uranotaenia lowii]|uniref:uncharacterized protein LOC129746609 n=1 Tax=Uranotaenia lowii TaxID=190385 RepID=UPI00247849C5|nr:uncharacterized protein LOC129746609 [Uranotaenia lowii]
MDKFKQSSAFQNAKTLIKNLVGLDLNHHGNEEPMNIGEFFAAQTEIHIMNILGHALNYELDITNLNNFIESDQNFLYLKKYKKQLRKVVQRMRSRSFLLIPLVWVDSKQDNLLTYLIKVKLPQGGFQFLDMNGRLYTDFKNFLDTNKFPKGFLCFPEDGEIRLNENHDLSISCRTVGTIDQLMMYTDVVAATAGVGFSVASIFATGGLAAPAVIGSALMTAYGAARDSYNLYDMGKHEESLNPFKNAEARRRFLSMVMHMFSLTASGSELLLRRMMNAGKAPSSLLPIVNNATRSISTGLGTALAVDTVIHSLQNWKNLTLADEINLICSICFGLREVLNYHRGYQLLVAAQSQTIWGLLTKTHLNVQTKSLEKISTLNNHSFKTIGNRIFSNDRARENGTLLVHMIAEKCDILLNDNDIDINFFGIEYNLPFLMSMPTESFRMLTLLLKGMSLAFKEIFSLLRKHSGDDSITKITFDHAKKLGGEDAHYGQAINELLQVFKLCSEIPKMAIQLVNLELIIGNGHCFTISSAFRVFIKEARSKGWSLLIALTKMTREDAERFNRLRTRCSSLNFFEWIIAETGEKNDERQELYLKKLHFLLEVDDACTTKSQHITQLCRDGKSIEIESLIQITIEQFLNATNPVELVDVSFLRMCNACVTDRKYLQNLWIDTCVSDTVIEKGLEKLDDLKNVFKKRQNLIPTVVAFCASVPCTNLLTFSRYCLFFFNCKEIQESAAEAIERNKQYYFDFLKNKLTERTILATKLGLVTTLPSTTDQANEPEQIFKQIKTIASSSKLRLGSKENAALQMTLNRTLMIPGTIDLWNHYIANASFEDFRMRQAESGVVICCIENENALIVVKIVQHLGAYIDKLEYNPSSNGELHSMG